MIKSSRQKEMPLLFRNFGRVFWRGVMGPRRHDSVHPALWIQWFGMCSAQQREEEKWIKLTDSSLVCTMGPTLKGHTRGMAEMGGFPLLNDSWRNCSDVWTSGDFQRERNGWMKRKQWHREREREGDAGRCSRLAWRSMQLAQQRAEPTFSAPRADLCYNLH